MQSDCLKLNCIALVWVYLCNDTDAQSSRTFLQDFCAFVFTTVLSSPLGGLLESVVRTKKSMEESSQRAHLLVEIWSEGAISLGQDRGLNLTLRCSILSTGYVYTI